MKKKIIGAMVTVSVLTLVLAGCGVEEEKTTYENLYDNLEEEQQLEEQQRKQEFEEEFGEVNTDSSGRKLSEKELEQIRQEGVNNIGSHIDKEVPKEVAEAEEEYIRMRYEDNKEFYEEHGIEPLELKAVWVDEDTRAFVKVAKRDENDAETQFFTELKMVMDTIRESNNIDGEFEKLKDDPVLENRQEMYEEGYERNSLTLVEDERVPELVRDYGIGTTNPVTGELLIVAKDGDIIYDNFIAHDLIEKYDN